MCVTAGGNVNAKDRKGGQTPVYLAAAAKQWDCVKYLLESGADSSIPCQVGASECVRDGEGGLRVNVKVLCVKVFKICCRILYTISIKCH